MTAPDPAFVNAEVARFFGGAKPPTSLPPASAIPKPQPAQKIPPAPVKAASQPTPPPSTPTIDVNRVLGVNPSRAKINAAKGVAKAAGDISNLDAFVMNGAAKEMEANMLEDKFVLGRIAILGQSTVIYSWPNVGKTLLNFWLLIDAIKRGEIDPKDVYYINADDHHKGLIQKLKLAELYGFNLLAPGYNGFKPEMLFAILSAMVLQDKAHGKILFLDTAKKFTDLMDKKKGSAFGESVRQFVMHGGTVISLAHANKHRNDDGNLIYAGTTDLVDDCDAAYILDEVSADKATGIKTVKFTNFKNRGDNALEAVYEYKFIEGLSYLERLESVRSLSPLETDAAVKRKTLDAMLERNREAMEAIIATIRAGTTKKTDLIKAAMDLSALPRGKIATALKEHTGNSIADFQFWHVNVQDRNAHVFQLNCGI